MPGPMFDCMRFWAFWPMGGTSFCSIVCSAGTPTKRCTRSLMYTTGVCTNAPMPSFRPAVSDCTFRYAGRDRPGLRCEACGQELQPPPAAARRLVVHPRDRNLLRVESEYSRLRRAPNGPLAPLRVLPRAGAAEPARVQRPRLPRHGRQDGRRPVRRGQPGDVAAILELDLQRAGGEELPGQRRSRLGRCS